MPSRPSLRPGARSIFVRFAGCNLWNGRPEDRDKGKGACARWCDTDFVGGEKLAADALLKRMNQLWPWVDTGSGIRDFRWCVLTGGEPALQVDGALIYRLHESGWLVAVETNGTKDIPFVIDWITLSPKLGAKVVLECPVDELKVILPGALPDGLERGGWAEEELVALEQRWGGKGVHLFVQPQDPINRTVVEDTYLVQTPTLANWIGPWPDEYRRNLGQCIDFVTRHPKWRLSTQQHKQWRLP